MDSFEIEGGRVLKGTVDASGSKNAALPILFAALLCPEKVRLRRVPRLQDIKTTLSLLEGVGARVERGGDGTVEIELGTITTAEAPYDLVRTMRASVLMLGPLLARERKARVSLPGGCAIGSRPVDIHLSALELMGAELKLEAGYIVASCPAGLKGAEIPFRFPSVGATQQIMMAASLAEGRTVIRNAAREPEIENLGAFLRAMGARISGDGTDVITIDGVSRLHGCDFEVMFDRIEAATLLLAGPITGGVVRVNGMESGCLEAFLGVLRKSGVAVTQGSGWVEAASTGASAGVDFETQPHPGYPTDLQAQMMAYLAQVGEGTSRISETIFENRFMHVPELVRMGADIRVEGGAAVVHGRQGCYQGAIVMATDLRASASLVLAGLAAKGVTRVRRIYHLDRGYESLELKLSGLGAAVVRRPE
jgi:UDP-N-acetylglucosamine 1-carboxyvinyltransferase